jgi:hypothetical protein
MVAPVPGKDARPHSLVRWEEAKHVVDDLVRESADPVEASLREGYLVPAPWRHSVEHTAVSALHECRKGKSIEEYTR